ncbi:MAG: chalcone isomerase family protein [Oleispira antarctica]|uniref:Chalcone isomerase domain-containing protein n=1 Tax=Oleispira antarctica RB-8 TaxID=698738 RepID=R4YU16_OLEAN|nr:chalcone isomerase family protein [Oleispira antarctica]MBQ0793816.1 chalcone isomerase family protein [Oleispira antarctica]CCK76304.1 conserved hypothetical protein [Oleispira antarctica RB-8]
MLRIMASFIIGMALMPLAQSKEVNDIEIADSIQVAEQSLVLNGAGIRSKFFLNLYVGALYLNEKSSDADALIAADEAMTIRLYITSSLIDGEKMSEATLDGFVKSTGGKLGPIQKEVEMLIGAFRDAVENEDVFDLQYVPNQGVSVIRNGEVKVLVPGLEFKKALFGIWLSDDPVQDDLREDMLDED